MSQMDFCCQLARGQLGKTLMPANRRKAARLRLPTIICCLLGAAIGACGVDDREPSVSLGGSDGSDAGALTSGAAGAQFGGSGMGRDAALPVEPAGQSILTLSTETVDFGVLQVGAMETIEIQLENTGDEAFSLMMGIRGANAAVFSIAEPCPEVLSPGASCSVGVRFSATVPGRFDASLELTTEGQDALLVPIVALVGLPGVLSTSSSAVDFGSVEVNTTSLTFTWTIINANDVGTGPLTLDPALAPFAIAENGCTEPLGPNGTCAITVSFAPTLPGPFSGNLQLGDGTQSVSLSLTGEGAYRLIIDRIGTGELSSDVGELECSGSSCTGMFSTPAVSVTARTSNGSGFFFSGWSLEDCQASQRCSLDLTQIRRVAATFLPLTNNLIFTSSSSYPPTLGGLAAYDAECNQLASAAGINDTGGNAFIAAMSDSANSLRQRLGTARGWVRMDGNPFADTAAGLFDQLGVIYPVHFDETGVLLPSLANYLFAGLNTWTGTLLDGSSSANNCNDWTTASAAVNVQIGRVAGGPRGWIDVIATGCDTGQQHLLCMGRARSAPTVPPRATGRQMWTVFSYTPGTGMTPDQKCQSERPPGVAAAAAFVAYSDRPAAAVLSPDVTYVRPDGAVVGLGRALASFRALSIPWLRADGTFIDDFNFLFVWTGASTPDEIAPDPNANCDDWRNGTASFSAAAGDYGEGTQRWFATQRLACSGSFGLYCVEQ
jgi:hypothetical protein